MVMGCATGTRRGRVLTRVWQDKKLVTDARVLQKGGSRLCAMSTVISACQSNIRADALSARDLIDVQSFIWVTGETR
jgi:hypothetical protein